MLVLCGTAVFLLAGLRVGADDVGRIKRRGKEHADIVEKGLHALVLESRTTGHRSDLLSERTLADSGYELLGRDGRGIVEVFLHESVVTLSCLLYELVMPLLSVGLEIVGDLVHLKLGAERLVVPDDGFHLEEVHHTLKVLLSADRNSNGAGISVKDGLHLTEHLKVVGAGAVHLVHKSDTGNIVFVGLTPHCLALGLYATYSAVGSYGTIKHTEGTLHLGGEVHVSRCVDEVDLIGLVVPVPVGGGSGGSNGDTSLLLLLHPVHGGGTVMHLTDLVSLAGIDVSHDADVACET